MKKPIKNQLARFEIQLTEAVPHPSNPMATLATAKILYTGNNRNDSHITPESVKLALPTLGGIPVVGEYDKDKDNFKDHGGEVIFKGDEVEFIDTTTPWGYVSELSKFYYEDQVDKDGVTRTYLVADRVHLWTGRYPQLNTLLEEGTFNQSMEIEVQNGSYAIIGGKEVFRIDEFIFSALCILGVNKDSDPYGHIEPCFEGASITINKDENSVFSKRYSLMMEELKDTPEQAEGGKAVNKLTGDQWALVFNAVQEIGHYKLSEEVSVAMFNFISTTDEAVTFEDVEHAKAYTANFTIEEGNVTIDLENKVEAEGDYSAIFSRTKTINDMNVELFAKEKELETANATIATKNEEAVQFQARIDELVAGQVDVEELKANAKAEFEAEHQATLNDALEQVGRLTNELETTKGEFTSLSTEFESAKTELDELRAFRASAEAESIKEKFSGQVADDIIESTLEKFAGKTIEEIESALYVEIGKQNFSAKKVDKKNPVGVAVPGKQGQEDTSYGGLFSKHGSAQ